MWTNIGGFYFGGSVWDLKFWWILIWQLQRPTAKPPNFPVLSNNIYVPYFGISALCSISGFFLSAVYMRAWVEAATGSDILLIITLYLLLVVCKPHARTVFIGRLQLVFIQPMHVATCTWHCVLFPWLWFSHRSCATEHKTMITEGFIDGDLVERFLDLSQTQMEEVCKGLKVYAS